MINEIKIIVADDHPAFRGGVKWAISTDSSIEIVGEAENGEDALELIRKHEPDLVVLDVDMPKMTGFDVARKLQNSNLATEVIILTVHNDEDMFNKAMDLGVKGYLLKESAIEDIVEGIKTVAKGKNYINSSLSTYLFNRSQLKANLADSKPTINDLTPTQLRILRLVSQEKTSQEIADELFISVKTVHRHRENICRRLDISGNNALLKFALANKSNLF